MQGFKRSIQSYHGNHIRIPVLEVFINCWKGEFNDSSTDPSQRSLCAWVNAPRWITAFLPFRSNPCALLTKLASSGWMMDSLWEALSGTISELNNPAICSNPPGMSYGTAFFEREKPWKHNDKPISSVVWSNRPPEFANGAPWVASQLKQLKAQQENLGRELKCHNVLYHFEEWSIKFDLYIWNTFRSFLMHYRIID